MGMSTAEKNRYWKAIKAGASHARARAIALGSRRNPDAPGADGSQVNAPDDVEEEAAPEVASKPEKKGAKGSTSTRTEVRSPTSTRTEVRSPTSTRTEVRSPTSTGTSTKAHTSGNVTVTGGAGAGANTKVYISGKEGDRRITDVETSSPSTDQASHRSNPQPEHIPARDLRVGDSFWSACGRREKPEWWTITKLFGHDDRDHIRVEARNSRTGKVVEDSMDSSGVAYAKRWSRSNPGSGWIKRGDAGQRGLRVTHNGRNYYAEVYPSGNTWVWLAQFADKGVEFAGRVGRGEEKAMARAMDKAEMAIWRHRLPDSRPNPRGCMCYHTRKEHVAAKPYECRECNCPNFQERGPKSRKNPGYGDADFSFEWIAPDGSRISAGDTVEYWRRTGLPHGAKPVRTVKKVLKMLVFRDHVQVNYGSFGDTVDASNYIRRVSKRTEV